MRTDPDGQPATAAPPSPTRGLAELLRTANRAVDDALAVIARRRDFGANLATETKSSKTDLVTQFDRLAEAAVRSRLELERPADAIVGEEGSDAAGSSGLRWVVDPIDGTTNFVYGHHHYAVSVAVEDEHGSLVGAVADATTSERFWATRGGGAFLDDTELRLPSPPPLSTALVATGFGYDADDRRRHARRVAAIIGRIRDIRRVGAASLDFCAVACGRVDAYFEADLAHWDFAAGSLIAREAGATVSAMDGAPIRPGSVLAAHPDLHRSLLDLLAEVEDELD